MGAWWTELRRRSLGCRVAFLAAALALLWLAVAPLACGRGGWIGLLAAGLAAAVCGGGSAAALAVSQRWRGPVWGWYGLLGAMALRTGAPLVFVVIVRLFGGVLDQVGFIYYIVLFYLTALALEVPLSIPNELPG